MTTRRGTVETRERRKNRRKLGSKLKDEFSIISTETEIQGQEVILIMKHVKVTVQGEKYQDKDEVNKAKIEGAPQQYIAKHFIEESCSQSRSIHEPMELSSRCTQVVWPSGGNNCRQHPFNKSCYLEQGSQGREQDFRKSEAELSYIVETLQIEISILEEGNRHTEHEQRGNSSLYRDRCCSLSSAADGAAVPGNIQC